MRKVLFSGWFMLFFLGLACQREINNYIETDRLPAIFPDYSGIMIPPNIAPLNFIIQEKGENFAVSIYSSKDERIDIRSNDSIIHIPMRKWHSLLAKSKGMPLYMDVFIQKDKEKWIKYRTITNQVSEEEIDSYLAYRLINTGYVLWNELGIWQRNLENFSESPILENRAFGYGCLNCHAFKNNDPGYMMLHTRAIHGGTIIGRNGKLIKINTKASSILSAGVYPCWHPDGNHIAFSVNTINQHFANGPIRIEVSDEVSDLVVYDIEKNEITTCPQVSGISRENIPVWSPDGKYIYFISAPPAMNLTSRIIGKYDLLRIAFDSETNTWGEIDTILTSRETGKSITFPKVSPNGRFLMFSMSNHGYFTIHHPGTDLYLLDLKTGEYHEMEVNSPETESYHSFSSKGHWFVFSSKRMDGLFTRPFFSYLDDDGKATKPFVMPQENPEFYNYFLKNYNIPELITGKVKYSPLEIRDKIMEDPVKANLAKSVDTSYMNSHLRTGK